MKHHALNFHGVASGVVFLLFAATLSAEPPSAEQLQKVSKSVVQIRARGCRDRTQTGSGFVWPRADTVTTALHVVDGCSKVAVYYENYRVERVAQVVHTLPEADLALLSVSDAPDVPPIQISGQEPKLSDELSVVGYELGVPTMSSKSLRVAFGSPVLGDMVNDQVRDEIKSVGAPSLGLKILRLEGHLLPGHSGAPIVNRSGALVAIADGGLERGAASVSWGLPTSNLERLLRSSVTGIASTKRVGSLFSADLGAKIGITVTCGKLPLTKMRTRTFQQLAYSADDQIGLQQLMFDAGGIDPGSFDIYVHRDTGATVVVPAGANLLSGSGMCTALGRSKTVRMYVGATAVGEDLGELQDTSVQFEQAVIGDTGRNWYQNPNWTYVMPHQRFDGLLVRRRSYVGSSMPMAQANAFLFETLMTRDSVFVGSAAVNLAYNPAAVQFCRFSPQMPQCGRLYAQMTEWVAFSLAVHLSTFPVG